MWEAPANLEPDGAKAPLQEFEAKAPTWNSVAFSAIHPVMVHELVFMAPLIQMNNIATCVNPKYKVSLTCHPAQGNFLGWT